MGPADQIQFFAATDVGRKRAHNEDNFLVDKELSLFVVADGMGGHAAGEVASAMAVRTVHEVISAERDMLVARAVQGPRSEVSVREILGLLEYAVQTASQRIHADAQRDPRKRGMGTTLSLLLVLDAYGYVAHVGDSRVYMIRGGVAHQVTEDHTVANELVRLGMVTPDQLDRVPRKNAITRAVGVYQHAEVDTLTVEILPSDQFLLASDGLCGYLDESDKSLVQQLEERDGEKVISSLISFANESGGKDNITAVLVRLGSGDDSDSHRARRLQLKREMLAAMPLFSRLNDRELLRVMQAADVCQYEAGEFVVQEGEHGNQMFVTLEGKLQVRSGKTVLHEIGPGEHFGEMALIRSSARSASVKAVEPSEVISISRDDFFDIIRTEPHIAVKLLWQFLGVLANRLDQTSQDLSEAREALGQTSSARPAWVDEEPSLDPFTAAPMQASLRNLQMALQGVSIHGSLDGTEGIIAQRILDAPPHELAPAMAERAPEPMLRDDAPSFDDAPAMAERIADPPSFDSGSGVDVDGAADRIAEVAARMTGEDLDAPFDAKSTVPRVVDSARLKRKLHGGDTRPIDALPDEPPEKKTLSMAKITPRDESAGSSAAKSDKRPRHNTLKSAGGPRPAGPSGSAAMKPGPAPVAGSKVTITSADASTGPRLKRDAATMPDGMLREARDFALSEVRTVNERDIGELEAADDEATPLDRAPTLETDRDQAFRPTKVTMPLNPPDSLRSELDALRKEFKERLSKSRKARESKESGRKDGD